MPENITQFQLGPCKNENLQVESRFEVGNANDALQMIIDKSI